MADGLDNLGMASPQSALDFAGIGALRGKAQQRADKATRETATQFEAMFIQEMLKSMRATVEKNDLLSSDAADTFEQMYDRELSVQLAKRNTLGIADVVVKAVERNNAQGPAFKAKAEPMPLNRSAESMAIQRDALPMKLMRPEKFNLAPRPGAMTSKGSAE